jgi:hypothetical protein
MEHGKRHEDVVERNVRETKPMKAGPGSSSAKVAPAQFEEMLYWLSSTRSEFDLVRFRSHLPASVRELDDSGVSLSSKDESPHGFHVVFTWKVTTEAVLFSVEYHIGELDFSGAPIGDEGAPYAEDFMVWLGQFFSADRVKSHVHARFEYPLGERESTFSFTLSSPLPGQAEVNGISLKLPANPQGASSVRMTRGETRWYTEVVSEREISFKDFSPNADAALSLITLGIFLGDRT